MANSSLSQMGKPRLLDLFCCAGGAGIGYRKAGFEVVGVDINLFKHDVPRICYQLR
jgi:site-specific DNA-cytosine methylase